MNNSGNSRWTEPEKLVLGIDIGTTYSAVAYAHLYPGGLKTVRRVASWPGQSAHRYDSKVPSIIWYDSQGNAQSFCAQARVSATVARAEQEGWYLAEHFKLHVHPSSMSATHFGNLIPFPPQVTIERIYADLLRYLFDHTKRYFEEKEFELEGARQIWNRLESGNAIDFVLCHPTGWGISEQMMLRKAVVEAKLVPSMQIADELVQFLGEAEASVHFVMHHADLQSRLQPGVDFIVCDAGGSTVDTTLYTVSSITPSLVLKEKRDSACIQAGGIFVDKSAKSHFQKMFYDSGIDPDMVSDYVTTAVDKFITEAKPSFKDITDNFLLLVADRQASNPSLNIEGGYLTLTGYEIEAFFEDWVDQIIQSVQGQIGAYLVKYILLVGGFGESPYLRKKLQGAPNFRGIPITVPDQSGAKAASEGSVLWYINRNVVARATRFAFGSPVFVKCSVEEASLLGRPWVNDIGGQEGVDGRWSEIVGKGHVFGNDEEVHKRYIRRFTSLKIFRKGFTDDIYSYDPRNSDDQSTPTWVLDPHGSVLPGFQLVCSVKVDYSMLGGALQKMTMRSGNFFKKSAVYWKLEYSVAFTFGATELRAYAVWKDNGVTRRGPASIIPITRAI